MSHFVKNIAACAAVATMLFGMPLVTSQPALAGFKQQGSKLVGTGATGNIEQGSSVAVSADGNTAIVGGPYQNKGTGSVWIFMRNNGVWKQQGSRLIGSGAVGRAMQGSAVALSADGNTAVFGGRTDNSNIGATWVFTRSNGVWKQQGPKLVGTGTSGTADQGFSIALSADGNTALVGGPFDNGNHGAAWVFTRSNGVWTQQGPKLVGTAGWRYAEQGRSVALSADGDTAIIGGPFDGRCQCGASWVFTRSGGVWKQQGQKLIGTGADNTAFPSIQGTAVALSRDGNTALVGGPGDKQQLGAAWVFTRTNRTWTQQGSKLVGTGAVVKDSGSAQGTSVSLSADGNTALVGGPFDNNNIGATWVFTHSNHAWTQQGKKLVGAGAVGSARQGAAVALSGDANTAVIGGPGDNTSLGTDTGATWVFVAAPTVTGVNPMTGPARGGTNVTISGTNFTGATAVKFGTTNAASFTVRNATTIVARTPAHPKGNVLITVTTSAGSGHKAGGFTFN